MNRYEKGYARGFRVGELNARINAQDARLDAKAEYDRGYSDGVDDGRAWEASEEFAGYRKAREDSPPQGDTMGYTLISPPYPDDTTHDTTPRPIFITASTGGDDYRVLYIRKPGDRDYFPFGPLTQRQLARLEESGILNLTAP